MESYQNYDPSFSQQTTNTLYGNHYKFSIDRLPDLSFFVQGVNTPEVSGGIALQQNPMSVIHHPGDRLSFGQFTVTYLIDSQFKNYFSLYYWMKGYGFPNDYNEVTEFRAKQQTLVPNFRAKAIDLEKTHAVLSVLTPDTSQIVAEVHFYEIFPTNLSSLNFVTTDSEPPVLTTTCTFSCSTIEVVLV
jgi:hypothetical protein